MAFFFHKKVNKSINFLKMIIEKRIRIRNKKFDELEWVAEFGFNESSDWQDEHDIECPIVPWPIVLLFAIFTGLSAYAIYSYFFG